MDLPQFMLQVEAVLLCLEGILSALIAQGTWASCRVAGYH
jgi:hypothetical protein